MPQDEVRGDRAVYDHETEDPRGARRRPVADWGVGEEIFDRMPSPRRRFGRGSEAPPSRRESHPRERRFDPTQEPAAAPRRELTEREVAPRRELTEREVAPRRELTEREAAPRREVREREIAPRREAEAPEVAPRRDIVDAYEPARAVEAPRRELAVRDVASASSRGGVEGRRTVVIGGQASVSRRPRPSRTVGERVGPRPDRLAAYAVALGLLLIVITFLTQ